MGGGKRKDPAWKYGTQVEVPEQGAKKGYVYLQCNFCGKRVTGGVKRLKDHLGGTHRNVGPCEKVPEDVKKECLDYMKCCSNSKQVVAQRTIEQMFGGGPRFGAQEDVGSCPESGDGGGVSSSRGTRRPMDPFVMDMLVEEDKDRKAVCLEIGRFFYENGIAFNVAKSQSFLDMVESLGDYGSDLEPPSMYELQTRILNEEVKTTMDTVDQVKTTWAETGVTVMLNGWSDTRHKGVVNFLVNNPHGTVFLKSVDASAFVKDSNLLFKMLDRVVEEVGEDIVVQVMTDDTSAYKDAGRMLMEKRKHLYWTPCAAHSIDLILEKLGQLPQHKYALVKAKRVSKFIYNYSSMLNLMRKFTQKEIIRPAVTRFTTAYLTLQRIKELKQPLEAMFASQEWYECSWAKRHEGKQVKKIISKDDSFWRCIDFALKTASPLVNVLRLIYGEKAPTMGFLYEAMDRAKDEIVRELEGQEAVSKEIWDIIDEKWGSQLHHDLYAAAYYLNPQCHYEKDFQSSKAVKTGLCRCMDRLIPDENYVKVDAQFEDFDLKRGMFGLKAAQLSYKTRSPERWWMQFGDDTPELKAFAVKVLSLTCSTSAWERNWGKLNRVHAKRKNQLVARRMSKVVYVMYNKKLKDKHLKLASRKCGEEFDRLNIEDISSSDEWLVEKDSEGDGDEGIITLSDEDSENSNASIEKAIKVGGSSRSSKKENKVEHQR